MITCNRCGKDNQDHYKFCLGCGAELGGGSEDNVGMMKTMMADGGGGPPANPGGVGGPTNPGAPAQGMPPQPGMAPPPQGMPPQPGMAPAPGGPPPGMAPAPGGPPPGMAPAPGGQPPGMAPPPKGMPSQPGMAPPHGSPSQPGMAPPQGMAPPPGVPGPRASAPPSGPSAAVGPAPGAPRNCPSCNAEVPPAFKFCGVCGHKMEALGAAVDQATASTIQPSELAAATMTLIRPDGSEGGVHNLQDGENLVGRNHGDIFESDGYLSPSHAEIVVTNGEAAIRDTDSLNGVFVRMSEEEKLDPGQVLRIGQELLRFDPIDPPEPLADGTEVMGSPNPGYWGKVTVIIGKEVDGAAFPLLGDSVTMGRERGDINFPDDGYVSGLHARLFTRDGSVFLADLGSSNGTFIKVHGERALGKNSFVLLGQQLFRVDVS